MHRAKGIACGFKNPKSQIQNKLQIPISNDQRDFVLNFGDWDLFEFWCLVFGASPTELLYALCALYDKS